MPDDFLYATLGAAGRPVFRLGFSASHKPGEAALRSGIEAGMNYLLWYLWQGQMTRVPREVLPANRDKLVVATGVNRVPAWLVRRLIDRCRRTPQALRQATAEGKIRAIAVSTHMRRYGPELAQAGWRKPLRRPGQWPASERIPSAGDCYRVVHGNPKVDVCLTAPRSAGELEENLAAAARGPLSEEEMSAMRRFGDVVHERSKWF